ncbi:hypothetical protein NVP1216O_63 [Vibrio phage 1.216.O._10N.222.55.C12]|nr:hypothetical protein NVP1135O_70 [Vibrio phage 1.135.O._10N.222.54.B6]AUR96191.1 hypothetical protein NVP1216O_63 [Vibrio phage 1.216.O._10N.222.55.C12]
MIEADGSSVKMNVHDWLYAKKIGAKFSYSDFQRLHAANNGRIQAVVTAYCRYFMKVK